MELKDAVPGIKVKLKEDLIKSTIGTDIRNLHDLVGVIDSPYHCIYEDVGVKFDLNGVVKVVLIQPKDLIEVKEEVKVESVQVIEEKPVEKLENKPAGKVSFIVTGAGTINVVVNHKNYVIPKDHINYNRIKEAILAGDAEQVEKLSNVAKSVENFTAPEGNIKIENGVVYWKDKPMHNALTSKIFTLMREKFPFEPMLKFLENLMANPSKRAVEELYGFLEHQGLPITEDGCFLGYKRVTEDYKDCHTRTVDNSIGKVIEMPRNEVDDDWANLCSSGFHVGSIQYVRGFHTGNPVVIVKVNPKDVVSVPTHENTKLRTCRYEVVGEYDRSLIDPMEDTLYSSHGTPVIRPYGGVNYQWEIAYGEDDE